MLMTRPPRIRDSWQEPGLPIPCQVRGPIPCRPALDFHGFSGPIHADCSPYSNGAIIHSRSLHTHPQSPCICIPSMPAPRPPDRRGFAVGLHRQVRWQALSGAPIVTQVPSLRRRRGIGLPGVACPPGGGPLRLLRPGEQIPWERWGYEPRGAVTPKAPQLYLFGYLSQGVTGLLRCCASHLMCPASSARCSSRLAHCCSHHDCNR